MKTITGYKTSDGEFFESKSDASVHEAKLNFAKWYEDNKVYGTYGERIDAEAMTSWLIENKLVVTAFLKTQK